MENLNYLIFCLFLINLIFIRFYKYIKNKYDLYDKPNEIRKKQLKPVPLLGGLLFLINILAYFFYEYFFNFKSFFYTLGFLGEIKIFLFCICTIVIFLIGYIDDKINLKPFTKLILVSVVMYIIFTINPKIVINSLDFSFYDNSIDLFSLGVLFSIFCILTYINSLNMLDGINLISGFYYLSIIMTLFLYNYQIPFATTLLFSTIFFIILNYDGKIYLGDSGVYLVSFLLSLVIIGLYETNKFHVEKIFLLMFLPIIDFFRLIIKRLLNRKHPFEADENHFHLIIDKKYKKFMKNFILFFFIFMPILFDFFFINNELVIIIFMSIMYYFVLKKNFFTK
jgi:UDP-GlcNAc:undecaprenyl-phosphate/decaprenyl-phosphate GlcNAc-1-phosphate transferase